MRQLEIFGTTLRDGAQGKNVSSASVACSKRYALIIKTLKGREGKAHEAA